MTLIVLYPNLLINRQNNFKIHDFTVTILKLTIQIWNKCTWGTGKEGDGAGTQYMQPDGQTVCAGRAMFPGWHNSHSQVRLETQRNPALKHAVFEHFLLRGWRTATYIHHEIKCKNIFTQSIYNYSGHGKNKDSL